MERANLRDSVAKNGDLEVLRAVAVSFVLFTHLGWDILPKLGAVGARIHSLFQFWTGVDLFFAISGFIITASLLRERAALEVRPDGGGTAPQGFLQLAVPFWIRRIFRLLPSAWLWVGLTLLLTAFFNTHLSFGLLRYNLAEGTAAIAEFANFYYAHWLGAGHLNYGTFGPYWSLSLEEQFYLLFPFLLYFLPRRALAAGLGCAALAQIFLSRVDGFVPGHSSLLWFIRTDAIVLGVLIALWQKSDSYRRVHPQFLLNGRIAFVVVALCVLGLAAAPAALPAHSPGIVAVISAVLVFIASFDRNYVLRPGRCKNALIWVGSRSYSIYLIHETVRALFLEIKFRLGIPEGSLEAGLGTLFSLAAILALSELNYRLIETPGRRFGRKLASRFRNSPRETARAATEPGVARMESKRLTPV